LRHNIKLVHRRLILPRPGNGYGAVTDRDFSREEKILLGPSRAAVDRIMNDLTAHLQAIHVAPGENLFDGGGFGGEFHVE
jgi:hypothetical protein